jgi:gluconolactonase
MAVLCVFGIVWGSLDVAAIDLPPAEQITPIEVLLTPDYTEGVVIDHEGNLYFSHGRVITRLDKDGVATAFADTGAPNGHKILADGTHLVCDAGRHAVLHLDADGKELPPLATTSDGEPLRGPNDLTLDTPHHGLYFTDPGGSDLEHQIGTIHYTGADGVTRTAARGLAFPNGIVLRPDGKELLVAESKKNRVLLFPVMSPGELG